jgi:hypothetical protein
LFGVQYPEQLKAILVRIIEITSADRIEIYPLDGLVQTKIVKGVHKNHLHGLLFKLGMLNVWRNTIAVTKNFEALPDLVSSVVPASSNTIDVNGCSTG